MSVILSCGLNNVNWMLGLEVAMGVRIIADLCNYCYLHQGSCFGPTCSVVFIIMLSLVFLYVT